MVFFLISFFIRNLYLEIFKNVFALVDLFIYKIL